MKLFSSDRLINVDKLYILVYLCSEADSDEFLLATCLERLKTAQDKVLFAARLIAQVEGCLSPRSRHRVRCLVRKETLEGIGDLQQRSLEEGARARYGMWITFAATTTISALSGVLLYILSVILNKGEGEAVACTSRTLGVEPPTASESRNTEWMAWTVQKIVAPAVLFSLLSAVRKFVTERELHHLTYDKNGMVNFAINSLSKGLFFAVKECPGLLKRELWARVVVFVAELAGAFYLWCNGGYYEQDVPDA